MKTYVFWGIRIVIALLLINTLRFKFSGAPVSIYIFETIFGKELESFFRIGTGIAELLAAILLLIPKTIWAGAGLSISLMVGALFFHFTFLGIEVRGDNGELFIEAIVILVLSGIVLWINRKQILTKSKKL